MSDTAPDATAPELRPALLRLAKIAGRITIQDVWRASTHGDRRSAIELLLQHKQFGKRAQLLRKAAEVLRKRSQAVATMPVAQQADAVAKAQGLDADTVRYGLQLQVAAVHGAVTKSFLDELDIPHEHGLIPSNGPRVEPPSADDLAAAADNLLREYDAGNVLLCLVALRSMHPEIFVHLGEWLTRFEDRLAYVRSAPDVDEDNSASPHPPADVGKARNADADAGNDPDTIAVRIDELERDAVDVALRLRQEAQRIEGGYGPVDQDLPADLSDLARRFIGVHAAVIARTGGVAATGQAGTDSTEARLTLPELRAALVEATGRAASRARTLETARSALGRALRVRHRSNASFAPLIAYYRDASSLLERLNEAHINDVTLAEAELLADGSHPITALTRLVAEGAEIEEDEGQRLYKIANATFGTDLLAALQRLTLAPTSGVPNASSTPVSSVADGAQTRATDGAASAPTELQSERHSREVREADDPAPNLPNAASFGASSAELPAEVAVSTHEGPIAGATSDGAAPRAVVGIETYEVRDEADNHPDVRHVDGGESGARTGPAASTEPRDDVADRTALATARDSTTSSPVEPSAQRSGTQPAATATAIEPPASSPQANSPELGPTAGSEATTGQENDSGSAALYAGASTHAPEQWPQVARHASPVPEDLEQLARLAKGGPSATAAIARSNVAWHLLAKREPALGACLADIAETEAGDSEPWAVPAWLARAVALAPALLDSFGPIAEELRSIFENVLLEENLRGGQDETDARRLLLVAATLRPALLAPLTGAGELLGDVYKVPGFDALWVLGRAVAEFAHTGHALSSEVLGSVSTQADWDSRLRQLQDDAGSWLAAASMYSTTFQGATAVWRKWMEPGDVVHRLIHPVIDNDATVAADVRELAKRFEHVGEIDRLVDQTDRRTLGRPRGERIHGSALMRLRTLLAEALGLARQWLDLLDIDPRQGRGRLFEPAIALRKQVAKHRDAVLAEFDRALSSTGHDGTPAVHMTARRRAGVACARAAVLDVLALLSGAVNVQRPEPSVARALNGPLLQLPAVRLDEEWRLAPMEPHVLVGALVHAATAPPPDWLAIIKSRIEADDFVGAQLALQWLDADAGASMAPAAVERLQAEWTQEVARARKQIDGEIDRLELEIERGLAHGVVSDAERSQLLGRLAGVRRAAPSMLDVDQLATELRAIADALDDLYGLAIEHARERMTHEGISPSHPDYKVIADLLARRDPLAAEAYLEMAKRGERPPEALASQESPLRQFLAAAEELTAADVSPTEVAQAAAARGRVPGFDFSALTAEQATQAAGILRAWNGLRQSRSAADDEYLSDLLHFVGFRAVSARSSTSAGWTWSSLRTTLLSSATDCPVPSFGSQAGGHYRLLWVWGTPLVKEVLQEIEQHVKAAEPVIVLFLGRLTEARRREFRAASRERRVRFVVLDELLLAHLATLPGGRLGAFFACALPFTVLMPYHTTAGEVPPELFVGRQQELGSVMDPNGTSFVYGGRQLGKTAILRDAQRRFHDPRDGRVAVYIDLKATGVGVDRTADALWDVLAQEFRRHGVLGPVAPSVPRVDAVADSVRTWLREHEQGRILVLLDEADSFFEKDARPKGPDSSSADAFPVSARLKGLMEESRRRFKVVFAGLHNVQRMTQIENHPLAHLPDPICIGPLVANGEWREAAALVTRPLAAMGYELAPELVTRILMQTNYYPSLIQRYCAELMRHVLERGTGRFDSRSSPPHEITDQQVQEAYLSRELRGRIRDSFTLTLNLDPRYRVIALALAYHVFTNASVGLAGELSVAELRDIALQWWPEGFADDPSIDTFRALLDEMVGLGILRHAEGGQYAFRSANVQLLMGTEQEVLVALETPLPVEVLRPLAPAVFRRPGPSGPSSPERSPLTAQQEMQLRAARDGAAIIAGTPGAGLEDVVPFLRVPRDGSTTRVVPADASLKAFKESLDAPASDDERGTRLVLVGPDVPWTEAWIHETLDRTDRRRGKVRFLQVAFVAGPETLWGLLSDRRAVHTDLERRGLVVHGLRPWHEVAVRQWVEDLHRSAEPEWLDNLRTVTGFWPGLLMRWAEAIREDKPSTLKTKLKEAAVGTTPWGDEDLTRIFGLHIGDAVRSLQVLREYGALSLSDWHDAVDDCDRDLLETVRTWADVLGLISLSADGLWTLDPVVARVIPPSGG